MELQGIKLLVSGRTEGLTVGCVPLGSILPKR